MSMPGTSAPVIRSRRGLPDMRRSSRPFKGMCGSQDAFSPLLLSTSFFDQCSSTDLSTWVELRTGPKAMDAALLAKKASSNPWDVRPEPGKPGSRRLPGIAGKSCLHARVFEEDPSVPAILGCDLWQKDPIHPSFYVCTVDSDLDLLYIGDPFIGVRTISLRRYSPIQRRREVRISDRERPLRLPSASRSRPGASGL